MKKRPHLLITNDDGINAPGIRHLWQAVKDFADISVVAPSEEQSAVGLSITIRRPLSIKELNWPSTERAYSINGSPADCVKMALTVLLPRPPDLIISGINRGTNAGCNVLYSGTVGAVMEGALRYIPGIAFSLADYESDAAYDKVEAHIPKIIQYALEHPAPKGTFFNVNFPACIKNSGIKGIRFARQGREYWIEAPERREHPVEGHSYYWLGAKCAHFEEDSESDIAWLKKDYATVVPIHVGELTDHAHLEQKKAAFNQFMCEK